MPRSNATSLEKALILLKGIVVDGGQTPFNEVASSLDLPPSTSYRMVSQLVEAGFVNRYGPNQYGPGLPAALLYRRCDVARLLARIGKPVLKQLASETGLTSHLGVLENGMVTYKVRIPGKAPRAATFTREGMQLEAYCSGVGKVLLAGLSDEALEDYLDEGDFVPLTPRTLVAPSALRQNILNIRRTGIAIDDREVSEDMVCIAVPVTGPMGETVAAVSVSMPFGKGAPNHDPLSFRPFLEKCSKALGAFLGASQP
ncbi:MAG: IclR family transcriptional regulator [Henriciella sp.]|uniref:IclR family transcriptional regulator n=1 Tax=uncultured Henriciella sp. TaxID=1608424 RepID=UPI000C5CD8F2|nr:IclR family transcriptional regulator [Henriciella sp.]MAN74784.1 IclR family transcriptional regulator [Henriciella sp.]MBF32816.1 IclR family transcriptional regulator [Hyphomonadaceae bacterium]MBK75686.1 IclR family transcriptional regulator [Henriciella sp.]